MAMALSTKMLPAVLGIIAGSVDAIGFLGALERIGFASLRPLLMLQLLLLAGFFALCASVDASMDLHATKAILAGMLGVSAMAVQNALVQIALKDVPSTAVMGATCEAATGLTSLALPVALAVLAVAMG